MGSPRHLHDLETRRSGLWHPQCSEGAATVVCIGRTMVYAGGAMVYAGGAVVYAGGTVVYAGGTVVYVGGTVVYVDGVVAVVATYREWPARFLTFHAVCISRMGDDYSILCNHYTTRSIHWVGREGSTGLVEKAQLGRKITEGACLNMN